MGKFSTRTYSILAKKMTLYQEEFIVQFELSMHARKCPLSRNLSIRQSQICIFSDKSTQDPQLDVASSVAEMRAFAARRTVRGFYPKVSVVSPEALALLQAADAASGACVNRTFPLEPVIDSIKAGESFYSRTKRSTMFLHVAGSVSYITTYQSLQACLYHSTVVAFGEKGMLH